MTPYYSLKEAANRITKELALTGQHIVTVDDIQAWKRYGNVQFRDEGAQGSKHLISPSKMKELIQFAFLSKRLGVPAGRLSEVRQIFNERQLARTIQRDKRERNTNTNVDSQAASRSGLQAVGTVV